MKLTVGSVLALAIVMVAATVLFGWWGVPVVAALWAVAYARQRGPRGAGGRAALAAALAWLAILLFDAARGPVLALATTLGGVMRLPPAVLVVVTLAFPALMGLAAATLAAAFTAPRRVVAASAAPATARAEARPGAEVSVQG